MSAVIDIAKDIAESVRKHGLDAFASFEGDCVVIATQDDFVARLYCTPNEAARVVALARGEK